MILFEIRNYLVKYKCASIKDLSAHFDCEAEGLRGMLDLWIRKGKIKKHTFGSCWGKCCSQCCSAPEEAEIYEWSPGDA